MCFWGFSRLSEDSEHDVVGAGISSTILPVSAGIEFTAAEAEAVASVSSSIAKGLFKEWHNCGTE